MASTYFTLPSFARAKRNQDELRKSNPQVPILKAEDEKFLERQISQERASPAVGSKEAPITIFGDDGEQKEVDSSGEKVPEGQVVVPETRPEGAVVEGTTEGKDEESHAQKKQKKEKQKEIELPSQEEAEAATKNWDAAFEKDGGNKAAGEKRTWASYLPSLPSAKGSSSNKKDEAASTEKKEDEKEANALVEGPAQRTWAEYASSYVPSMPKWRAKDADAAAQPVLREDGSIDEAATAERQEKEVSVLLDRLDMSSINNRVFALSADTQRYYERFAQALRDTIEGVPTAYDDMEQLMRDAGPTLERQFKAMPPFVQALVKSLPAKIGTALAPELLAAASDKPGADLKAAQSGSSSSGIGTSKKTAEKAKKAKRNIPGLKSLMSKQGAVAGILRNVVTFIQTRFPFLASTTNVVMSLAVFSEYLPSTKTFASVCADTNILSQSSCLSSTTATSVAGRCVSRASRPRPKVPRRRMTRRTAHPMTRRKTRARRCSDSWRRD